MVRNIAVKVSLDYEEWNEIRSRANKEHLSLASYIRRYLFDHQEAMILSPVEPVRNGIPARIVSNKITQAVKKQSKMAFVIDEMHQKFNDCVYYDKKEKEMKFDVNKILKVKVTEEMKMEVYENRKKEEYKPIKELHPPK